MLVFVWIIVVLSLYIKSGLVFSCVVHVVVLFLKPYFVFALSWFAFLCGRIPFDLTFPYFHFILFGIISSHLISP